MKKVLYEVFKIVSGNRTVRKSTNALVVTLVGGIGTALSDGKLTHTEIGVVVGVALVATSAVWKSSNEIDPDVG